MEKLRLGLKKNGSHRLSKEQNLIVNLGLTGCQEEPVFAELRCRLGPFVPLPSEPESVLVDSLCCSLSFPTHKQLGEIACVEKPCLKQLFIYPGNTERNACPQVWVLK